METRVSMYVVIDDETGHATMRASVSKWDDEKLTWNSTPYHGETNGEPIRPGEPVYPYAVSVLRDTSDTIVADLLHRMNEGAELFMHEVNFQPIP